MGTEMTDGIIRQRRNLLVCSIIYFGFIFLGIEIMSFTLFGAKIELANSNNVSEVILFFWIYFLWRFYQYSTQIKNKGIASAFNASYSKLTKLVIGKLIKRKYPDVSNEDTISLSSLESSSVLTYTLKCSLLFASERHSPEERNIEIEFFRIRLLGSWLRSSLSLIIHEPRFSDYILPYIVAALVFMYSFVL